MGSLVHLSIPLRFMDHLLHPGLAWAWGGGAPCLWNTLCGGREGGGGGRGGWACVERQSKTLGRPGVEGDRPPGPPHAATGVAWLVPQS